MIGYQEQIGKYLLLRQLGKSPLGETWLAATGSEGKKVVVKELTGRNDRLTPILQDALVWLGLTSLTHVAPVLDLDVDGDRLVLVVEEAPNGSLQDRLDRDGMGVFPLSVSVSILNQLLAGLEQLHCHGVIHGNLKPSNLLLFGETIRLTDYGLGKLRQIESGPAGFSGGVAYAAPQTLEGTLTPTSDLWSAGVIFYQLVSGKLPFPQTVPKDVMWAILTHSPQPLPHHVPAPLRTWLDQVFKGHFQSATDMRQALNQAGAGCGLLGQSLPANAGSGQDSALPPRQAPGSDLPTVSQCLASLASPAPASRRGTPAKVVLLALLVVVTAGAGYWWQQTAFNGKTTPRKSRTTAQPVAGKPAAVTPTAKPEAASQPVPPTALIVSADGSTGFSSINAAIARAEPGGCILVRPGLYRECVFLTKAVEIRGDGPAGRIILESTDSPCLHMQTAAAEVAHLTLRAKAGSQGHKASAVNIPQGCLTLQDCDISSDSLVAVAIYGPTADPIFRECRIHDGASSGIAVWGGGQGTLQNCEIYRNRLAGVVVSQGSHLTLSQCAVTQNGFKGIRVYDQGTVTLAACDLANNRRGESSVESGGRLQWERAE